MNIQKILAVGGILATGGLITYLTFNFIDKGGLENYFFGKITRETYGEYNIIYGEDREVLKPHLYKEEISGNAINIWRIFVRGFDTYFSNVDPSLDNEREFTYNGLIRVRSKRFFEKDNTGFLNEIKYFLKIRDYNERFNVGDCIRVPLTWKGRKFSLPQITGNENLGCESIDIN